MISRSVTSAELASLNFGISMMLLVAATAALISNGFLSCHFNPRLWHASIAETRHVLSCVIPRPGHSATKPRRSLGALNLERHLTRLASLGASVVGLFRLYSTPEQNAGFLPSGCGSLRATFNISANTWPQEFYGS